MSFRCRSGAGPMPVRCRSDAGPVPVRCRSDAGPVPVRCRSDAGPVPVQCRSDAGPVPVRCRSGAGPMPVQCRFGAGLHMYAVRDGRLRCGRPVRYDGAHGHRLALGVGADQRLVIPQQGQQRTDELTGAALTVECRLKQGRHVSVRSAIKHIGQRLRWTRINTRQTYTRTGSISYYVGCIPED